MNSESILLVDDEPELRAVCQEALQEQGYTVLGAGNGRQALEVLSRQPVALVVTDLSMPQLDGLGLLRGIVERRLDTDVIFLTGYGTVENAVECLRLGACDYLLKPFDVRKLLTTVAKVMEDRQRRKAADAPSQLHKLFALNGILSRQEDLRSLVKEFLALVRADFQPEGLAFFLSDQETQALRPGVFWGSFFGDDTQLRDIFAGLGREVMTESCCRVFSGRQIAMPRHPSTSVLAAPIVSGPFRTGAIVLARNSGGPAYTEAEATLLSMYAAHAASAIEGLRAARRLSGLSMQVITSYVRAVEAKDPYTRGHSERVSEYAMLLGGQLGMGAGQIEQLRVAGMLHDIGKIGVPDSILNKPARLTPDEFEVMKRHPEVAEKILARIEPLKDVLPVIYHHHERYDGSGYPAGLKGQDIPYMARLISVVDGYEAMTSDRAYHHARTPAQALAILREGAGTQWDPELVAAWEHYVVHSGLQPASLAVTALAG